jgi:dUTP pyrophosphatase
MVPTGLCSAFGSDYAMVLKERGSTGTKGIGQRSGIIDSGYRGEWLVPITNHNTWYHIFITKLSEDETIRRKIAKFLPDVKTDQFNDKVEEYKSFSIFYPYDKAICQALLIPVPESTAQECTVEEIKSISSKRGDGKLGSSGK